MMAERDAMLLTPDEYRDFRRMRQAFLGGSGPDKTRGGGFDAGADAAQTPEVHVALAPAGGIPALDDGAGTGTVTDDVTGSALCRVFRLNDSGGLTQIGSKELRVRNLSTTAVDAGRYVLAVRDKFGTWFAVPSGGTSGGSSGGGCGVPWPIDKAALSQKPKAFLLRLTAAYGRCADLDLTQTPAADGNGVPFYLCWVPGISKWRGVKKLRGVCEDSSATITLDFTTNWGAAGNLLDETVVQLAVTNPCDGSTTTAYLRVRPCSDGKIHLLGGGTFLCPTTAGEDDCNHEFVGTLECVDPPDDFGTTCECGLCTQCCRTGETPVLWEARGEFTGDYAEYAEVLLQHEEGCDWTSDDPVATLGWVLDDGVVRYAVGGQLFEIDDTEWSCCGTNTLTWVGEGDPPEGVPGSVTVEPILCGECDPEAECGDPADRYVCVTVTAGTGSAAALVGTSILLKWDPVHGQGNLGDVWSNDYSGGPEAIGWGCSAGEGFPAAKMVFACLTDPMGYPAGKYWTVQWLDGMNPPQVVALARAAACAGLLGTFTVACDPGAVGEPCYCTAGDTFTVEAYMLDSADGDCPPVEPMAMAAGEAARQRRRTVPKPAGGPGTELRRLLKEIGVSDAGCGGCGSFAAEMDRWGVEGCRARRDEIAARLREQAKARGWKVLLSAAWSTAVSGLAFALNPLDPLGSLVDEVIRRAEEKSANPVGEDANPGAVRAAE